MRAVSLVNWVVSKNVENQMEEANGRESAGAGEKWFLRQLRAGSTLSRSDPDQSCGRDPYGSELP